jgi:DNA-binding transcriptional LysR family regulator
MTDLNALVVFAHVAAANSFSEAARRLRMPTSTVSRRVAELENQLGVRLLDRTTRRLRLTEVGEEVMHHARQSAQINEVVADIASRYGSQVSGKLRIAAPPSISDSFLTPLICGFQKLYPEVRIHALITERSGDHIVDGVDLVFRVGLPKDSSLVGRRLLNYRHQLLATPEYLERNGRPKHPNDLLKHRLISFARWKSADRWTFEKVKSKQQETVYFEPYITMNDYAGIIPALLAGIGIGELPPIVQPNISRREHLVEVMPQWRFRAFDLWALHLGNRHIARALRAFQEFVVQESPRLFSKLPS